VVYVNIPDIIKEQRIKTCLNKQTRRANSTRILADIRQLPFSLISFSVKSLMTFSLPKRTLGDSTEKELEKLAYKVVSVQKGDVYDLDGGTSHRYA